MMDSTDRVRLENTATSLKSKIDNVGFSGLETRTKFQFNKNHKDGGWSVCIADWDVGATLDLFIDNYKEGDQQTYWFGFSTEKKQGLDRFYGSFPDELKPKYKFGKSKLRNDHGVLLLKDFIGDRQLDQYIEEDYTSSQHFGYYNSSFELDEDRAVTFVSDVIMSVNGSYDQEAVDVELLKQNKELSATEKQQLIDARRGQGKFRQELEKLWFRKCPVTAHSTRELLRASHIRSWRDSDDAQRLDPYNGILLSANIDALFDKHLVTFSNEGVLQFSTRLDGLEVERLDRPENSMVKFQEKHHAYLKFHRLKFESKQTEPTTT